ncbi:MAG: helix-turn-helix transcriptional regulator [Clostridia bacterium]|nr:helix-turn-helix transcriptional regulator [Clostridia bacterium]
MASWYGGILPGFREPKTTNIYDVAVDDKPICVMAFGRELYKLDKHIIIDRPNGRKDYLIGFVAKGSVYETPRRIIMKENSLVIYKPNEPQLRTLFDQNPVTTYWIHFSGNKVEEILDEYGLDSGIIEFEEDFPFFVDIIDRMYVAKNNPFWQDICNTLLLELFMYIGGAIKQAPSEYAFRRLMQYMQETCTQNLPIKVYADFIGFSEVYFVRFFKKARNITPHNFLIHMRLDRACHLLLHTDLPINQISDKVGYKTARYFSKAFFDRYGITPTEYRNKHSKKQ